MILSDVEILKEMEKGTIKNMDPRHFLMNMFSLMAYPLITNCLNKSPHLFCGCVKHKTNFSG